MTCSIDKLFSYYPSNLQNKIHVNPTNDSEINTISFQRIDESLSKTDTVMKKICRHIFQLTSCVSLVGSTSSVLHLSSVYLFDYLYGVSKAVENSCHCLNEAPNCIDHSLNNIEVDMRSLLYQAAYYSACFSISEWAVQRFFPKESDTLKIQLIEQPPKINKKQKSDFIANQRAVLKDVKHAIAEMCKTADMLQKLFEVELAIAPGQCKYSWNDTTFKMCQKYLAMFVCVKQKMFSEYAAQIPYIEQARGVEIPGNIYALTLNEKLKKNVSRLRQAIIIDLIDKEAMTVSVKNSVIEDGLQRILRDAEDVKSEIFPLLERFGVIFEAVNAR